MNVSSIVKNSNKIYALGKRKTSIAKLYLFPEGTGKFDVVTGRYNDYRKRPIDEYFVDKFMVKNILLPLSLFKSEDKYDIVVHVSGGGLVGQKDAIKLAIAKALLEENNAVKEELKSYKFLTRDSRCKERKKVGKYGARRSPQFTKR